MSGKTTTHYRTCNLCEAICGLEIKLETREAHSLVTNRFHAYWYV